MGRSAGAFFLSLVAAIFVAFLDRGFGIILAISIMGAFIVYSIEERK